MRWLLFLAPACLLVAGPVLAQCTDMDGDGFYREPGCGTPRDCNDADWAIHPGASEACDGYDNDCDQQIDNDPPCDSSCDLPDRIGSVVPVTDAPTFYESTDLVWTGSEFALVWSDSRNGNPQIFFARLDASGTRIGSDAPVETDPAWSRAPVLVWTGSEYGVSWHDSRPQSGLYFARLDATGSKIGNDIFVAGGSAPSLVWTGAEYGLAWHSGPGASTIHFTRLDVAGQPLAQPVQVSADDAHLSNSPSLAWNGTGYGVAWHDSRHAPGGEIYFAELDPSGNNSGEVRVTDDPGNLREPSLVWTGAEFGLAWYDDATVGGQSQNAYFARLDASGNRIGDITVVPEEPASSGAPRLAWTGSEYGILRADDLGGVRGGYLARISSTGTLVGEDMLVMPSTRGPLVWTGVGYAASSGQPGSHAVLGLIDCDCPDRDGDGSTVCQDCDDTDASVYPGAPELCDGVNNDCTDPDWPDPPDGDDDGFTACDGDCDDDDPDLNPDATELCGNGIDEDCDGQDPPCGSQDIVVDYGAGVGTWIRFGGSTWTRLLTTSPAAIVPADLDGDTVHELVVDFGGPTGVWIGSWPEVPRWEKLFNRSPEAIIPADIDGDGDDELVLDLGPGTGVWFWQPGATPRWRKLFDRSPLAITPADTNGDGLDELVVNVSPADGVWIWSDIDTPRWRKLYDDIPAAIAAADLDGDGTDELVVSIDETEGTWIWSSVSTPRWNKLLEESPVGLVVGDFDDDGRDDLVGSFTEGVGLRQWSTAVPAWSNIGGRIPETAAIGNLDADARDEMIVDFGADIGLRVYHLTDAIGSSSFEWLRLTPPPGYGLDENSSPGALAVGDLDDGASRAATVESERHAPTSRPSGRVARPSRPAARLVRRE